MPRLARSLRGWRGFSCQSVTASLSSRAEDAEAVGLADGHRLDRDGHVGAPAAVLLDEGPVVHLVDVVAGQDEHDVGARLVDGVEVGGHRIGRAAIPLAGTAASHVRLQDADAAELRSRSHGRPAPMWSLSERGAYCVRTMTLVSPELTQLESVKSMMRYLPPKGTAGLARTPDRSERRSPSPPARTTANVRLTSRCYTAARPASCRHSSRRIDGPAGVLRPGGAGTHRPSRASVACSEPRPSTSRGRLPHERWSPCWCSCCSSPWTASFRRERQRKARTAWQPSARDSSAQSAPCGARTGRSSAWNGAASSRPSPRADHPPARAQHRRRDAARERLERIHERLATARSAPRPRVARAPRPTGRQRADRPALRHHVHALHERSRRPQAKADRLERRIERLRRTRQARVHGAGAARVEARRRPVSTPKPSSAVRSA